MNTPKSKPSDAQPARQPEVPRDRDLDTAENSRRNLTPSPDTVNIRDEDYPSENKPLTPDHPSTEALHTRPPHGRDQLQTGSAGDAARPSKTGIAPTTLAPRGSPNK
jgi:hypothetical protein